MILVWHFASKSQRKTKNHGFLGEKGEVNFPVYTLSLLLIEDRSNYQFISHIILSSLKIDHNCGRDQNKGN